MSENMPPQGPYRYNQPSVNPQYIPAQGAPQPVIVKNGISPIWVVLLVILLGMLFFVAMFCNAASSMDFESAYGKNRANETTLSDGVNPGKVLVIPIRGVIGVSSMFPSNQGVSIQGIQNYLKMAEKDDDIVAYLLDVNSPGGSAYASDEIYRLIKKYAGRKPIYAHYRSIAASGGVYCSCMADKIYCDATGITGSIGVKIQTLNFSRLLDKAGMSLETIKSSEMKDILSPYRPVTDKEREVIQELVDDLYNRFVNLVAEGRKLSVEEVKEFADGRIFTPTRALSYKLIDEIANVDQVYADIRNSHGDVSFIEYENIPTLLDVLMNSRSANLSLTEKLLPYLATQGTPKAMYLYGE